MSLKLITVNVEQDKHFNKLISFLELEDADIVFLMEVYRDNIAILSGSKYPYSEFIPNARVGTREWGVAVMSKLPILDKDRYYCGELNNRDMPEQGIETHLPAVLMIKVEKEGKVWQLGGTHFSWTPHGTSDQRQKDHFKNLVSYLKQKGELVIMGDFNIARGRNELYEELCKEYKDNIPTDVISTIDEELHRVNMTNPGKLSLVVDYAWSTKRYLVKDVEVKSGVSDHKAIVSRVSLL